MYIQQWKSSSFPIKSYVLPSMGFYGTRCELSLVNQAFLKPYQKVVHYTAKSLDAIAQVGIPSLASCECSTAENDC